jgi:hypothetical protein
MPRPAAEEAIGKTGCPGKSRAWGAKFHLEEHPAFAPHLPCWKCGADMGCARCSGPAHELLCMDCHDWSKEAYDRHGRLLKTAEERAEAVAFLRSTIAKAS